MNDIKIRFVFVFLILFWFSFNSNIVYWEGNVSNQYNLITEKIQKKLDKVANKIAKLSKKKKDRIRTILADKNTKIQKNDKIKAKKKAFFVQVVTYLINKMREPLDDKKTPVIKTSVDTRPDMTSEGEYRVIPIDARRFMFTPNLIKVKKWEKVKLVIRDVDWLHGLNIPQMWISKTHEAIIDTSETWTFHFFCATYCWSGHWGMRWQIIVEE